MSHRIKVETLVPILEGLESLESRMYPGDKGAFRQLEGLKNDIRNLMTPPKRVEEAVSELSTGSENPNARGGRSPHYPQISQWWEALKEVLTERGITVENVGPIHTNEGRAFLTTYWEGIDEYPHEEGHVWFTWYRMPSGNLEIICGYNSRAGD